MSKHKAAILTGGSGFLGKHFIKGLSKNHQTIYILDTKELNEEIKKDFSAVDIQFFNVNVSEENEVVNFFNSISKNDIPLTTLLNAAASNPAINSDGMIDSSKFEDFKLENFNSSLINSLTGSALMCREFVKHTSIQNNNYEKLILNVGSDLSVIAPDNRIYNDNSNIHIVKPVSYSVVKHGVIGLTKYTAAYWASKNIRCNALAPGGIKTNQPKNFVRKISKLIPMKRMAKDGEYKSSILFLISDASSYMNGSVIIADGGRTVL